MIQRTREELADVQIQQFLESMIQLGFDLEETISLLKAKQKD